MVSGHLPYVVSIGEIQSAQDLPEIIIIIEHSNSSSSGGSSSSNNSSKGNNNSNSSNNIHHHLDPFIPIVSLNAFDKP